MASAGQSLETIFADIRDAGIRSSRKRLRRHAKIYQRNAATLLYWTFPGSRAAIVRAIGDPDSPTATRVLCRALWRDLEAAKALPRYLAGRPLRISALRMLFAGECAHYLRQRDRVRDRLEAPALTTGEWLTDICRAVEAGPLTRAAGKKTPPRTDNRPRGTGSPAAANGIRPPRPVNRPDRIQGQPEGKGNRRRHRP